MLGRKKPSERRKLSRRDFLQIISGDVVKTTLGSGELSTIKLMRSFDVIVDEGRCTLCGVCVRECEKGALFMEKDGMALLLKFDQSLCDGCPACEEKCPEDAIKVVEVEAGGYEVVLKASSKIALCTSCGAPIGPAKVIEKVASVLKEKGVNVQLQRLYLCQRCRGPQFIEHEGAGLPAHGADDGGSHQAKS